MKRFLCFAIAMSLLVSLTGCGIFTLTKATVKGTAKGAYDVVGEDIKDAIEDAKDGIEDAKDEMKDAKDNLKDVQKELMDAQSELEDEIRDSLGDSLDDILGSTEEIFGEGMDDMFEMDWSANSMQSIRQVILDSGSYVGVAYLGTIDGPIGTGLKDAMCDIENGEQYIEDLPFIFDIPFERYADADGRDFFVVLPLDTKASVAVNRCDPDSLECNEILYKSDEGDPIIVSCDASGENEVAQINIVDNNGNVCSFCLEFEKRTSSGKKKLAQNDNVYDFSIRE